MDSVLDIARWQFGIITIYHFLFVPLTIGLSALVAVMETLWLRTKSQHWLRLTKFIAKLFLINFALGVVTGIVQEFQFGMNWSDYSRFVGDVFGAPLAIEALLAFFLESTFLGLWIFGWDKLPRPAHAACMWIVHIGTLISSWFILAANSWMQHPVGYKYDATTGRAQLTDFWAVMFNKVQVATFPHVMIASYMTGAVFIAGICGWRYWVETRKAPARAEAADVTAAVGAQPGLATPATSDAALYRIGMRFGAIIAIVAFAGVAITGDTQGKVMTEVQPMKMASAEALWNTSDSCAPFSVLTIGTRNGENKKWALEVPCVLSFLATGHFTDKVQGINQLRTKYEKEYGSDPGAKYYAPSYTPIIPLTYWSFRWMMGLGAVSVGGGALLLWLTRRGRAPSYRWIGPLAISLPIMALLGNSVGWLFTEAGRQPWAVFGLMTTRSAVSPGVSVTEAWISLIGLTSLYAVLAVIEVGLLVKTAKAGAAPFEEPPSPSLGQKPEDAPLTFAY